MYKICLLISLNTYFTTNLYITITLNQKANVINIYIISYRKVYFIQFVKNAILYSFAHDLSFIE